MDDDLPFGVPHHEADAYRDWTRRSGRTDVGGFLEHQQEQRRRSEQRLAAMTPQQRLDLHLDGYEDGALTDEERELAAVGIRPPLTLARIMVRSVYFLSVAIPFGAFFAYLLTRSSTPLFVLPLAVPCWIASAFLMSKAARDARRRN